MTLGEFVAEHKRRTGEIADAALGVAELCDGMTDWLADLPTHPEDERLGALIVLARQSALTAASAFELWARLLPLNLLAASRAAERLRSEFQMLGVCQARFGRDAQDGVDLAMLKTGKGD